MPLDFPDHPNPGDQWAGSNGAGYVWDGSKWSPAAGSSPTGGPFLPLTGGILSGPLTIAAAVNPTLHLTGSGADWPAVVWDAETPGSAAGYFESQRGGKSRWSVEFGGADPETGANAGTNFLINRFDDSGALLSPAPLRIDRATGFLTIATGIAGELAITGGIHYTGPGIGSNGIGFTWSDHVEAWIDGTHVGALAFTGAKPTFAEIAADAWDPTAIPAGAVGFYAVTNQTGAANWPADNPEQAACIVAGYSSNPAWQTQLMMGGRTHGGGPAIWFRAYSDEYGGNWSPWYRLFSTAGGTLSGPLTLTAAGGINFSTNVGASPTDLSKHIALYGTTYGISVSSSRFNHVAGTGSSHYFVIGSTDTAFIGAAGLTVNGSVTGQNFVAPVANAALEIGSTAAVNTPFIDFHSSGNNIDYDCRLVASGGSATVGQGSLQFNGSLLQINSAITVSGATTLGRFAPSLSLNLTAAGATLATATVLPSTNNTVTTVASGTGVVLNPLMLGETTTVFNRGANPLNVYPQAGSVAIDSQAGGSPYVLAAGTSRRFLLTDGVHWLSS